MRRESIRQLFLLSVLVVIVFIYFILRPLSHPITELPTHGAEGASTPLPAALELRAEDVSDIIDDQGVFTRSVTIKSEDGKVQLDIAKGTRIKVPNQRRNTHATYSGHQ